MAALGACASITAQMYAKKKQWNLQSVPLPRTSRHSFHLDPATDTAGRCPTGRLRAIDEPPMCRVFPGWQVSA
jgi:hypothetical protein